MPSWTEEQDMIILEGLKKYGRDWASVARPLKPRTRQQVRLRGNNLILKAKRNGKDIFAAVNEEEVNEEDDDAQHASGLWSEEEKRRLLVGMKKYGKQWAEVVKVVKTRSFRQVHSQGYVLLRRQREGVDIFAGLEEREDDFSDDDENELKEPSKERAITVNPKRTNRVSLSPSSTGLAEGSRYDSENETDVDRVTGNGTSKKRRAVFEVVPSSRSTKKQRKAGPDARESENGGAPTLGSVSKGTDATEASVLSFESTNKQQDKTLRTSSPPKKTVTILGATGGTGMCLVKQALDAGHNVRALVRNPNKFPFGLSLNKNLTVSVGNVTEYEDVKAVIDGSTDVIVSLGGSGKDGKICSMAQPVIDKALNDTDPSIRMVVVTSMAVGDSYHDSTWMTRRFADFVLASSIKDKNLQERAVFKDTVNWVIVRPVGLSDGALTGTAQAGAHAAPAASKTISRADLAHFILKRCLSGQDEWKRNPVTVFPPQ